MSKQVTLIANDTITPYFKGDVFTVDQEVAQALLNQSHPKHPKDEEGNLTPVKVEVYNPDKKEHVAALEKQRGKAVDADLESEPAESNRVHELEAQLAEAKENEAKAVAEAEAATKATKKS